MIREVVWGFFKVSYQHMDLNIVDMFQSTIAIILFEQNIPSLTTGSLFKFLLYPFATNPIVSRRFLVLEQD